MAPSLLRNPCRLHTHDCEQCLKMSPGMQVNASRPAERLVWSSVSLSTYGHLRTCRLGCSSPEHVSKHQRCPQPVGLLLVAIGIVRDCSAATRLCHATPAALVAGAKISHAKLAKRSPRQVNKWCLSVLRLTVLAHVVRDFVLGCPPS